MTFTVRTNDDSLEGEADFKILKDIDMSKETNICILSKDSDMVLIAYSLIIKKIAFYIKRVYNIYIITP